MIIQTYQSDVPAIAAACDHDYARFFRDELAERRELGYPPFGHLVAIRIDGPDAAAVERAAGELAREARRLRGGATEIEVLGPAEAPLARLKGRTRWHLWLRSAQRRPLRSVLRRLLGGEPHPKVRVTVDVDPISTL